MATGKILEKKDVQVHKHGVGEYCILWDKPNDDGDYTIGFNPNDLKEGPNNCNVGKERKEKNAFELAILYEIEKEYIDKMAFECKEAGGVRARGICFESFTACKKCQKDKIRERIKNKIRR